MSRTDLALKPSPPARLARRLRAGGRGFGAPLQMAVLLIAGLLVWRLANVLLMAFGAVLVAILLQALARPLVRWAGFGRPLALTVAVAGLTAAVVAAAWLFGQQVAVQLVALGDLVPRAWSAIQAPLSASPLGAYVLDDLQRLRHADGRLVQTASRFLQGSASAGAATIIVLFAGLYLAFHPATYARGALQLIPTRGRERMAQVMSACGVALDRWLLGQLASMFLVGITVGLGLWWAGVPSPLALGVLAGLAQFVPVVGPMAATLPGLVVAAGQGPDVLAWTAAIYLGASQFEANIVTPLVLRQMVELPMAVTLFAVLAMGVLLGPLGVLFATPLAVVAYVVVRHLYVEDILGDRILAANSTGGVA